MYQDSQIVHFIFFYFIFILFIFFLCGKLRSGCADMTSFIYMYILYKCSEQNLNCLTKCLWLYVSLYAFRALITHFFPLQSF